jgi:polysaccharide biosynthesis transport protein
MASKFSFGARAEFAPLTLIRMFGKHKLGVALVSLVLCAISVVVVMMLPPVYKAEALILVESQKIPERYVSSSVGTDLQDRLATINQFILSTGNLTTLINDYGLYKEEKKNHVPEEIVEMMKSDIQIKVERGWVGNRPGAFRIAYMGASPTIVAEVANKLAQLYVTQNLTNREMQAKETQQFIASRLAAAKKKLDEMELAVSQYKLQHNGELPEQENALNGALSRLQMELQGIQEAINRGQQNKVMIENALSMAESTQADLKRSIMNEQLAAGRGGAKATEQPKRKASEVLEEQLSVMRLRYKDDFPDVKRLEAQLAKVKAIEAEDAKKAGAQNVMPATAVAAAARPSPELSRELTQAQQRVEELRTQLKLANHELETRAKAQERVLAAISMYERRLSQLPVRQQEMEKLTRDYESSKANHKRLTENKESADTATDMEMRQVAEKFQVLDNARIPEKPYSPNRPLFAGLACIVSLLIGFAYAVVKELKRGCLLGEWELPAHVAAIGRVPRIDFVPAGARPGRLRTALVSSAVISLGLVVVVGLYFAWSRM